MLETAKIWRCGKGCTPGKFEVKNHHVLVFLQELGVNEWPDSRDFLPFWRIRNGQAGKRWGMFVHGVFRCKWRHTMSQ